MSKFNKNFPLLLSKDGTKFAISSRTPDGQFGQPLTKDGTLEDIKDFLIDIGLISEDDENNTYSVDIQNMSEYFAKTLQSIIQDENHILYEKFIEHKTQGIQNDFQINLERILDRDLDSAHKISSDINHMVQELYENFLQLNIVEFKHNTNQYNNWSHGNHWNAIIPAYDTQALENFTNEFDALINMIIMSILVEYGRKDSQKYFPKNSVLKTKINSIKNKLFEAIHINQSKLTEILICSFCTNNYLLKQYEIVTGIDANASIILGVVIDKNNISHSRTRFGNDYKTIINVPNVKLTNDNEGYYYTLLDMLAKINLIEEFLNRLIDSCTKQNDTTQSTKLLQLLYISNSES